MKGLTKLYLSSTCALPCGHRVRIEMGSEGGGVRGAGIRFALGFTIAVDTSLTHNLAPLGHITAVVTDMGQTAWGARACICVPVCTCMALARGVWVCVLAGGVCVRGGETVARYQLG